VNFVLGTILLIGVYFLICIPVWCKWHLLDKEPITLYYGTLWWDPLCLQVTFYQRHTAVRVTLWYTMLSQWQSSWPFVHVDHHWDQRERASLRTSTSLSLYLISYGAIQPITLNVIMWLCMLFSQSWNSCIFKKTTTDRLFVFAFDCL